MSHRLSWRRRFAAFGATLLASLSVFTTWAVAAPQLSATLGCWIFNQAGSPTFPVYGTGFPPHTCIQVGIAGNMFAETDVSTDAAGNLVAQAPSPPYWTSAPTTAVVQASQLSLQQPPPPPLLLASLDVPAVSQGASLVYPYQHPRLSSLHTRLHATWGGYPGATLYAHYLFNPRSLFHMHMVRTVQLGPLMGPCGTLDVSFPVFTRQSVRVGYWEIIVDLHRQEAASSAAGPEFRVLRPAPPRHAHRRRLFLQNLF